MIRIIRCRGEKVLKTFPSEQLREANQPERHSVSIIAFSCPRKDCEWQSGEPTTISVSGIDPSDSDLGVNHFDMWRQCFIDDIRSDCGPLHKRLPELRNRLRVEFFELAAAEKNVDNQNRPSELQCEHAEQCNQVKLFPENIFKRKNYFRTSR